MEVWYAPLPCSTCAHPTGDSGVYVSPGVHFCATCLPLVMAVLSAQEPHDRRSLLSVVQTPTPMLTGASS